MIRIRLKATGEIKVVTPNVAHDLIDSGKADLAQGKFKNRALSSSNEQKMPSYANRQLTTSRRKRK